MRIIVSCILSLLLLLPLAGNAADHLRITTAGAILWTSPESDRRSLALIGQHETLQEEERRGDFVKVTAKEHNLQGWLYGPAQGWFTSTNQTAPKTGIHIGELRLQMIPRDAEVLFRKEPNDTSDFPVTVLDDPQPLHGTIEVKGSFTRTLLKKSLLITLPKDQQWHGQRRISLNAMATDDSRLREWLAWDLIHRLGMTGPKVEYTRLYINDEFIGLYLFIEWITPAIFADTPHGAGGELYHPDDRYYCGGLEPASESQLAQCWLKLSPNDNDRSRLSQLTETLATLPADKTLAFMEKHVDLNALIDWLVVNTVTSSGDSYNKNYFLYYSRQSDKWVVVPWDFDLTFGRNADPVLPYPSSILNGNFQYFYPPDLGSFNALKAKVFNTPELYQAFLARLQEVLGLNNNANSPYSGWFSPSQFSAYLDAIAATIESNVFNERYAGNDIGKFYEQFDAIKYYNQARYSWLHNALYTATPFNTVHWAPGLIIPPFEPEAADKFLKPWSRPISLMAETTLSPAAPKANLIHGDLSLTIANVEAVNINHPLRLRVEAETEQAPRLLPPGKRAEQCVQRSWYFDIKTPSEPLVARLTLEYLQETSVHHELGSTVGDEQRLQLWSLTGNNTAWHPIPTTVNTFSNTLTTAPLEIPAGQLLRLIACRGD